MKIKFWSVIFVIFVFLSIVASLGGTYYSYNVSNKLLQDEITKHLNDVSQATENHVITYFSGLRDDAKVITQRTYLKQKIIEYNNNNNNNLDNSAAQKELESLLHDSLVAVPYFERISVISVSGKIIASTSSEVIGSDESETYFFINGKENFSQYFFNENGVNKIFVTGPFKDKGNLEGVVVLVVNLDQLNGIVSEISGLGESGEVLLAYPDSEGKVIPLTNRKYSSNLTYDEVFARGWAEPMKSAINRKEKIFLDATDYRGVDVLAVSNYIKDIGIASVTKIDYDEALGIPRDKLLAARFWIVLIISIVIGLVALLVSRVITKPLANISGDLEKITHGELDVKLRNSYISEIQGLTDSLNRILASMKLAMLRTGATKEDLGLIEQVKKEKKEIEDKYKIIFDTSADAIMTIEPPTWKFTTGNPATFKIYGVKDEKELISLGPYDLSPKYQPNGKLSSEMAKVMIMKAMKEGSAFFEWTHKKYKGESFPATVLLTRMTIGGKTFLQATVRDITKQKEIENKFNRLVSSMADIPYSVTKTGIIKFIGPQVKKYGYKPEDFIGKRFTSIIFQEDRIHVLKDFVKTFIAGKSFPIDFRIKAKDGKIFWFDEFGDFERDESGKIIGLAGVLRDITSRKNIEIQSKQLLSSINDAVFIHDPLGNFLDANDAACKRLGYTREEFMKLSPSKIDAPEFAKLVPARVKELKAKGSAVFESVHMTKSGKRIPVEISAKVINYNGKPAIISVARDISQRKLLEAKEEALKNKEREMRKK